LAVVPIELPPLRARREDIPALVDHFLEQVCADNDRRGKKVASGAMTLIMQHDWPGNVRELKNVVERLAILTGDAEVITEADVGDALPRFMHAPDAQLSKQRCMPSLPGAQVSPIAHGGALPPQDAPITAAASSNGG